MTPVCNGIKTCAVFVTLVCLCSCDEHSTINMEHYRQVVQSGVTKLPEPLQMEALFGKGDHFISSLNRNGTHDWNSEVFFGGRYTLTMQVEVKTDKDFSEVTEVTGRPSFVLTEACRIVVSSNRVAGADFSNDWKFREDDWKKVVDANGDFSVIGIKMKTSEPLDGFDQYVKSVREPRIRVRPH
jgi:hypothetical protein